MLEIRKSADRGAANHGWLDSRHSFSFGQYRDPEHTHFGPLRVINDDHISPAQGFGTHGHSDMEILTFVIDGALEHKDSMGTGSVLHYGDVQRMSAGTGVQHSEFNHSKTDNLHLLQIWVIPNVSGIAPSYEEKHFAPDTKRNQLRLVASGDARQGSVLMHQDASIYAAILEPGHSLEHTLAPGRCAYVHLIHGTMVVNGTALAGGDALKLSAESLLKLEQGQDAEALVFDLPE